MKKLNTDNNGFGIVETLLVVMTLILAVGVGYYVYNAQKSSGDDTKQNGSHSESKPSSSVPEGWKKFDQYEVAVTIPETWELMQRGENKGESLFFKDSKSTISAKVYDGKAPRIYYDDKLPYFCQLDNGKWNNYKFEQTGSYGQIQDDDGCADVKMKTVNGKEVSTQINGLGGSSKYFEAVKFGDKYIVIYDTRADSATEEQTQESTQKLVSTLDNLVQQFTELN